jgi:hypothetical protein
LQYPPLRLGVLGAARIALGGIIPAAAQTEKGEIAVGNRGGKKLHKIRKAAPEADLFVEYDSLLEDADVEAVYVPLPNSMHVEWTLRAMEAGEPRPLRKTVRPGGREGSAGGRDCGEGRADVDGGLYVPSPPADAPLEGVAHRGRGR